MQTRLDERVIEHRVLFAASHEGEAREIAEYGPCAILPIKPEQATESFVSGRLSRSSRKSVRKAATGASVSAAKKRESAEREGNRSRSRPGHERDGKRLELLVTRLQRAFSVSRHTRKGVRENR